jgi:hypothetical protein
LRYTARILVIWLISKLVWWAIPHLFWIDDTENVFLYAPIVGYLMGWSFQPRLWSVSGWRIIGASTVATMLVLIFDTIVVNVQSLIAIGRPDLWLGDPGAFVLLGVFSLFMIVCGAIASAFGLVPGYLELHAQDDPGAPASAA